MKRYEQGCFFAALLALVSMGPATGAAMAGSPKAGVIRISDLPASQTTTIRAQSPDSASDAAAKARFPGAVEAPLLTASDAALVSFEEAVAQPQLLNAELEQSAALEQASFLQGCPTCDSGMTMSHGNCDTGHCQSGHCPSGHCESGHCPGVTYGGSYMGCPCECRPMLGERFLLRNAALSARLQHDMHRKFGYFCPTGGDGKGLPPVGHYHMVYAVDPYYSHPADANVYAASGYNAAMAVPLAPVVRHQYNYSWGVPSSRLTPISHPRY